MNIEIGGNEVATCSSVGASRADGNNVNDEVKMSVSLALREPSATVDDSEACMTL